MSLVVSEAKHTKALTFLMSDLPCTLQTVMLNVQVFVVTTAAVFLTIVALCFSFKYRHLLGGQMYRQIVRSQLFLIRVPLRLFHSTLLRYRLWVTTAPILYIGMSLRTFVECFLHSILRYQWVLSCHSSQVVA